MFDGVPVSELALLVTAILVAGVLTGILVGLCSSLMGVSGGSLSNLILMLYGRPIHNAVAISAGLGVPISLAGSVGYALAGFKHLALLPPLSLGFVSLIGVALMAPVS